MSSNNIPFTMQTIVNIPRADDPTNNPECIGKWFKVHFALGNNAIPGSYSLLVGTDHHTETIYFEPTKKFHSPVYLPYQLCKNLPIRIVYNDHEASRATKVNINDVLPNSGSPLSYTTQYKMEFECEVEKKQKINIIAYFTVHYMNYHLLSYTTFDLITTLKQSSRLALFDKTEYFRVFVYAVTNNYLSFIKANQNMKTTPESLQSFQDQGYLLYITSLSDEPTKSCLFPFVEFDTSLLQFAARPAEALQSLNQTGQLPPFLPITTYDDAIYLRFELRNDRDEVLAVAQESLPALVQPFASMQRSASRELAPVTVHSIGSNRLQQQLIYNHHVLSPHDKMSEPSVSHFQRKSKGSQNRSRGKGNGETWQPPADTSEQSQHRILKPAVSNPTIPQFSFIETDKKDKDLQKKRYGPSELTLYDNYPSIFSSVDKDKSQKSLSSLKHRGSLYIAAFAHYHLPTMRETFTKNNIILKPSIVLDYYTDETRKAEMDKTVDIIGNVSSRLEPFFSYRRLPHTQKEVDDFFDDYYSTFNTSRYVGDQKYTKLVDPELQIDRAELQREFEPGEPYILRNLEAAGVPITFLNVSPPSHLTPARDIAKLPGYGDKWQSLLPVLQERFPNKPEWQRYEFNNIMKASNNAHPTNFSPCNGINRRGLVSADNRFHRQIVKDGVATDEYSCDIFDARRYNPLLDLNLPQITPSVDHPLSIEQALYYCRAIKTKLRSSVLPLPDNYSQRKQDKMNGKIRANDNNCGAGAKTHHTYVQEFARELIIRTLLDVETKVYQTNMIEYHVVFVGGYRDNGTPEAKQQLHQLLREYLSMLPVSFIFLEYNEKTTQREQFGQEHTNGAGCLDQEGMNLLNETGMMSTVAPKFYAMQSHESTSFPIFTYDRRHLQKLQQEYLYPQRDMIIGFKKAWYLDKENKIYEYNHVVLPQVKQRLAFQVKQYLDIQFKSRCTFENMAQIMYPSPPGVLNLFEVQTVAPMKMVNQCAFYNLFFASDEGTVGAKMAGGDDKKAHRLITFEEEQTLKQNNRCPCCQVTDNTIIEATELLFQKARTNAQVRDIEFQRKLTPYFQVEYTATTTTEDSASQSSFSLSGTTKLDMPPPPSSDHIVDTSAYTIKLDHIATPATVRDVTNSMQWHIENLAMKIAQFKQQQGL